MNLPLTTPCEGYYTQYYSKIIDSENISNLGCSTQELTRKKDFITQHTHVPKKTRSAVIVEGETQL